MKVVDMHCDTISELYKDHRAGGNVSILENSMMIDLKKMQAGDYGLQNFALYTNLDRAEGKPFDGHAELGIMIETPAAAVISDLLAREVDFFSIGTNDLTQYTLAADRQNAAIEPFCDRHHEAVLRLIRTTVENAHGAGIWAGICGELAADAALTDIFLDMGVDELSMTPGSILEIKARILDR